MRRTHLIVGLLGVITFLVTGQVMKHHSPKMPFLAPDVHMMFVSRHIYLLSAALVNLALGLYLQIRPVRWRCMLQRIGSVLILLSPILLLTAFLAESSLGLAGRGWHSLLGLFILFGGVMAHFIASIAAEVN